MKTNIQYLSVILALLAALSIAGCKDDSMTVEGTPPNPDTHKDTRDLKNVPARKDPRLGGGDPRAGATGGSPSPSSSPASR